MIYAADSVGNLLTCDPAGNEILSAVETGTVEFIHRALSRTTIWPEQFRWSPTQLDNPYRLAAEIEADTCERYK